MTVEVVVEEARDSSLAIRLDEAPGRRRWSRLGLYACSVAQGERCSAKEEMTCRGLEKDMNKEEREKVRRSQRRVG